MFLIAFAIMIVLLIGAIAALMWEEVKVRTQYHLYKEKASEDMDKILILSFLAGLESFCYQNNLQYTPYDIAYQWVRSFDIPIDSTTRQRLVSLRYSSLSLKQIMKTMLSRNMFEMEEN